MNLIPMGLPVAGISFAFRQSDVSGQIIVLILVAGSILAWTIMITKMAHLKSSARSTRRFLDHYRETGHPLSLFVKGIRFPDSPVYLVYEDACKAIGSIESGAAGAAAAAGEPMDGQSQTEGAGGARLCLRETDLRYIRACADRTETNETLMLEENMGLLATAVTSAPFLGMLGTIWGVMVSFGSIKGTGAMLSEVAPGVSAALLTTLVGLLVALPSSIGYNMIATRIKNLRVAMNIFIEEFLADIEHDYLESEQ